MLHRVLRPAGMARVPALIMNSVAIPRRTAVPLYMRRSLASGDAGASSDAPPRRRVLPPSIILTRDAKARIAALVKVQSDDIAGVRLGIKNDWGSHTGFSYSLSFVQRGALDRSDERLELDGGAVLFVERKALWAGEGGLLGTTLDVDEEFNVKVTPKEEGGGRGS